MSSSASPTSFNALPPEIRNMIWDLVLASSEHRKPKVQYRAITHDMNSIEVLRRQSRPLIHKISVVPTPLPSLLHVCGESRLLALSHFNLVFKMAVAGRPIDFKSAKHALFILDPDFSKDLRHRVEISPYPALYRHFNYYNLERGVSGRDLSAEWYNWPVTPAPGADPVWVLVLAEGGWLAEWLKFAIERWFPVMKMIVFEDMARSRLRLAFVENILVAVEVDVLETAEFERMVESGDL